MKLFRPTVPKILFLIVALLPLLVIGVGVATFALDTGNDSPFLIEDESSSQAAVLSSTEALTTIDSLVAVPVAMLTATGALVLTTIVVFGIDRYVRWRASLCGLIDRQHRHPLLV